MRGSLLERNKDRAASLENITRDTPLGVRTDDEKVSGT